MNPNKPDFYHNRGLTKKKIKEFKQAIEDFSACLKLDPKHFKSFYNRGGCFEKIQNYELAE